MSPSPSATSPAHAQRLIAYPLMDALFGRRSHRFARGMRLNGGPLAYASAQTPMPLSRDEEAALAFAACGITGFAMADLPYQTGAVPAVVATLKEVVQLR